MKIAIIGYGKMGKTIEALAIKKGHTITHKITASNSHLLTKESLKTADVAIEFTRPDAAFKNIMLCFDAGIPVVCGTTGWLDKLTDVAKRCWDEQLGFLYASNFSIGVNILFQVNEILAQVMNNHTQYDVSMEEIHHTQKLDAPSGTAITIAKAIIAELQRKDKWVNQATTAPNELSIISKRIDKVPGTHTIEYKSAVDTIEIKHTAHSREGFALGAIKAAEFVFGKQGVFSMKDVI